MNEIRVDLAFDAWTRLMRGYHGSDKEFFEDVELVKAFFNQELKKVGLM